MADAMQKDEMCKGCYYEERSYTVGPCNECSRAFSGTQKDWYSSEDKGDWAGTDWGQLQVKQPVSDSQIRNENILCAGCSHEHYSRGEKPCLVCSNNYDKTQMGFVGYLDKYCEALQPDSQIENTSVKHPKHYKVCDREAIDIIKATLTEQQFRGFLLGNVMKYRMRAGKKGDTSEDIHKALEYEEMWERYYD